MKRIFFFIAFLLLIEVVKAQTTVTLYPDIDASVYTGASYNPNGNYGTTSIFRAEAWTSGTTFYCRSLMQIDLSSIPDYAIITSATLYLYSNYVSGTTWTYQSGYNESYIQRATTSWTETGVTWNNQPSVSTSDQITLARSTANNQNYTVDFKNFVQGWINKEYENNGFVFRLQTEAIYRRMIFASSDHATGSLHPKIIITYITPTIATIDPDKDALIKSDDSGNNFGASTTFSAERLNGSSIYQSLIETTIPENLIGAKVTAANLFLDGITTSGTNASYMERITTSWSESTVTYSNAPGTSTTNRVSIPTSTTSAQDYIINLKALYQEFADKTTTNYGFLMKLQNESLTGTHQLQFASSDHTTGTKPQLKLAYVPAITLSLPDKSICNGGNVTIGGSPTASGGTGVYTYAWSPATGLSSTSIANPFASPTTTTTYTVTVTDYTGLVSKTGSLVVYVSSSNHVYSRSSDMTFYVEGGTFYDSGGSSSNYSNKESYTLTFHPCGTGKKLKFDFTSFSLENCGVNLDLLRIYNGPDATHPLLKLSCGQNSPGTILSTDESGALTFVFSSNTSTNSSGWAATISQVDEFEVETDKTDAGYDGYGNIEFSITGGDDPYIIREKRKPIINEDWADNEYMAHPELSEMGVTEAEYANCLSDKQTLNEFQNLAAGIHEFTISDQIGNKTDQKIVVSQELFTSGVAGITIGDNGEITKTGQNGWGYNVATFENKFTGNTDGKIHFKIETANISMVCGLRETSNSQAGDYSDINYGFYLDNGSVKVIEQNIASSSLGFIAIDDEYLIQVNPTTHKAEFYKNNTLIYTSTSTISQTNDVDLLINTCGIAECITDFWLIGESLKPVTNESITNPVWNNENSGGIDVSVNSFYSNYSYTWYKNEGGSYTSIGTTQDISSIPVGQYKLNIQFSDLVSGSQSFDYYYNLGNRITWSNPENIKIESFDLINENYKFEIGGAVSLQSFVQGKDAWVEFVFNSSNFKDGVLVGFIEEGDELRQKNFKYGIKIENELCVYAVDTPDCNSNIIPVSGVSVDGQNENFRIELTGNNVKYYRNNELIGQKTLTQNADFQLAVINYSPNTLVNNFYSNITDNKGAITYANTSIRKNSGVYKCVNDKLYFIYISEYNETEDISFTVYDDVNDEVSGIEINDPSVDQGENKYFIDVTSLSSGYYLLEITNINEEKQYLRFMVE